MAAAPSPLDQKIVQQIRDTEGDLEDLVREIRPAVKNLHLRQMDVGKAVKATKWVLSVLDQTEGMARIQGTPVYKQLSPAAQLQVDWMHNVMCELLNARERLTMSKRQLQFKPEDKMKLLLKALREIYTMMPNAPRGTGPLIKELQKGVDPQSPEYAMLPALPMALLLWHVWDVISRGQKTKPRYR
jgi:hypothetical protein